MNEALKKQYIQYKFIVYVCMFVPASLGTELQHP